MTEQAKTITVTCPKCGEEIIVTNIEMKNQEKREIERIEEEILKHLISLPQEIESINNEITKTEEEIKETQNLNSDVKYNDLLNLDICSKQEKIRHLKCEIFRLQDILKTILKTYVKKDYILTSELEEQRKEN